MADLNLDKLLVYKKSRLSPRCESGERSSGARFSQQCFELGDAGAAVRAGAQRFADLVGGHELLRADRAQQRRTAHGEARAHDRAGLFAEHRGRGAL